MSRWAPGAQERLQQAALELFAEQGYAATTVPQITARAQLTTRTFFRYFADKREVLFAGDDIAGLATHLMTQAPATLDPMTLIVEGLRTVVATNFEGRREELRVRREIIRSDPGLQERQLRKRAAMSEAIRQGFIDRGLDSLTAAVAAHTGVTVLNVAVEQWLALADDQPLYEIVLDAVGALHTLTTTNPEK